MSALYIFLVLMAIVLLYAIFSKPKTTKQSAPIPYDGWKVGDIVVYRKTEHAPYVPDRTFSVTSYVVQAFRGDTVIYKQLFKKSKYQESELQGYFDSLCSKPQTGYGQYYEVVEDNVLKYNQCDFADGRGNISLIKRNRDKKQQELEAYVKAYQETT